MPFRRSLLALSLATLLGAQPALSAPLLDAAAPARSEAAAPAGNAWVEIDKAAFEHNIRQLQTRLAGKSQICAVMKADAYGHGIALLVPSVIASSDEEPPSMV